MLFFLMPSYGALTGTSGLAYCVAHNPTDLIVYNGLGFSSVEYMSFSQIYGLPAKVPGFLTEVRPYAQSMSLTTQMPQSTAAGLVYQG